MDFEKLRALQEATEQQRRLEQQLGQPIHKILEQSRLAEQHRTAIEQLKAHNYLPLNECFKAIQSPQWLLDAQRAAMVLREQINQARQLAEMAYAQPMRKVLEQYNLWNESLNRSLNDTFKRSELYQALQAGNAYIDAMKNLSETVRLRRFDVEFPWLTERILSPAAYFTHYTTDALHRLHEDKDEKYEAALQGALSLAEAEFSESSLLTESLLESEITIVAPSPLIVYNLYEEQERELIYLVGKNGETQIENIPSLFSLMKTREIAALVKEVLSLIATCNKQSRTTGEEDIFKITNAMFEAAADLPALIVKSNESLVSLVGHLYRILYEGAGDQKLRFLSEQGGCLERDECDVIWTLKALRNKLSFHDPEHGKEAEIRKSYATLADALAKLGLAGMPVTEEDYLALQKSLLSQMKDFLTNLTLKMRK